MTRSLQITIALKDEFLSDIIINASETAYSWFYFNYRKRTWKDKDGERCENDLSDMRGLCIKAPMRFDRPTDEEGTLKGKFTLDFDSVTEGLRRIISGECKCGLAGEIAAAVAAQDAGMIDSDRGDCIVQAAIFGEIVYG